MIMEFRTEIGFKRTVDESWPTMFCTMAMIGRTSNPMIIHLFRLGQITELS